MNDGFKKAIVAIENHSSLDSLNVSNNELTQEGMEHVKNIISNTNLKALDLS